MYNISPFVKWAGGKGQLLDELIKRFPKSFNGYYEPFIGGGALLLRVQPKEAHINDINKQLINIYIQLKNNPEEVIKIINDLDNKECNKEFYYKVREKFNNKISNEIFDPECAGMFIWINKHCFNGLYRVNRKGLFNVPYNNKNGGRSAVPDNLTKIGEFLKSVSISCMDFEEFCKDVEAEDFVYFDSPYIPESETADFTSYTKDCFNLEDHKRLAELFKRLDKLGAYCMLSNNDVDLVRELYKDYYIDSIDVKRLINRNANKRKGKEVIITNYESIL